MSLTTPGAQPAGVTVMLPPGVTVGAGRETSQTTPQGQIAQGMVFPVTLPDGSTTSVFVPYTMLSNVDQVRQMIASRVTAIMAITG